MRSSGRWRRAFTDAPKTEKARLASATRRGRKWLGRALLLAAVAVLGFGLLLNHKAPLLVGSAPPTSLSELALTPNRSPALQGARPIAAGGALAEGFSLGAGQVALTFDDGPHPVWTPRILDELDRLGVKATFFVVGEQVAKYPEIVRDITRRGHELGNHTQFHFRMGQLSAREAKTQLDLARMAVIDAAGVATDLYRPPYSSGLRHLDDAEVRAAQLAIDYGYVLVASDLSPPDFEPDATLDELLMGSVPTVGTGAVLTLHDGGGDDRSKTVQLLEPLMATLAERGYEVVTVGEAVAEATGVSPFRDANRWEATQARSLGWVLRVSSVIELVAIVAAVVFAGLFVSRFLLLALIAFGTRRKRRGAAVWASRIDFGKRPGVTVIVPAYNEAVGIEAAIRSIDATDWSALEILVVDDGSTDGTADVAGGLGLERVRVLQKPNGGKASALNLGIREARHDIIVMVDGDTILEPQTIPRLLRAFADPRVGAVAGNPKIGNQQRIARLQASEYLLSSSLERRILAPAQMITTIPGAVGAWQRAALQEVGGVSAATLAEDTDLTVAIARGGWRIAYEPDARAWTEAPSTVTALYRQRVRWTFGTLQVLWKHRRAVFDRRAGSQLGRVALPYIFVTGYLLAGLAPVIDLVLLSNLLLGHWELAAISWAAIALIGGTAAGIAAKLDEDPVAPALLVPLQQLLFRPLLHLVVVVALRRAVLGEQQTWGAQRRVGGLHVKAAVRT